MDKHRPVAIDFQNVRGRGLVKLYGATRALSGVNISFDSGTVTAVQGHNGSGKTTLLSLLGLLAKPTRGTVWFGEHDARRTPGVRGRVGMMGHAAMVYPDLTAHEHLLLLGRLHRLGSAAMRIQELCDRFGLGTWSSRPARTYSRGQLQRLALASSLLHRPRLLLLDEPSTGLDASSVERLSQAVEEERERGTISVLVTHDPALAERLADRRVELRRGRVVEST